MEMAQSTAVDKFFTETKHHLSDKWVLWAHLPHDTDWTLKSYINIVEFETVEEVIAVINTIPQTMIKNCMLFVMKEGINPTWEDERNSKGGCFSFKIMNKQVCSVWIDLLKVVAGNTISTDQDFVNNVNGITISPKKSFCIMKIWMSGTDKQNPKSINPINGLNSHGCLFKKHNPEY